MARISYRTSCAGVEVKVKGEKALEALFKRLGGTVGCVTDKSIEMVFPTQAALDEFKAAAKAKGAIFESVEEE